MDEYKRNEIKGRSWFSRFINETQRDLVFIPTETINETIDGFLKTATNSCVIEIKTRNKDYEKFKTHWIEIGKFMNIVNWQTKTKSKKAYYVNFFDWDTVYIYDLKKVNSQTCNIVSKWVWEKTVVGDKKVLKRFFEIPREFARIYKWENYKWKRIQ